jgi:hypothetical protein
MNARTRRTGAADLPSPWKPHFKKRKRLNREISNAVPLSAHREQTQKQSRRKSNPVPSSKCSATFRTAKAEKTILVPPAPHATSNFNDFAASNGRAKEGRGIVGSCKSPLSAEESRQSPYLNRRERRIEHRSLTGSRHSTTQYCRTNERTNERTNDEMGEKKSGQTLSSKDA